MSSSFPLYKKEKSIDGKVLLKTGEEFGVTVGTNQLFDILEGMYGKLIRLDSRALDTPVYFGVIEHQNGVVTIYICDKKNTWGLWENEYSQQIAKQSVGTHFAKKARYH